MSINAVAAPDASSAHLRKVGRGARLNLVGAAVSAVASFALVLIFTHELSRRAAGLFFTTTSLFLLASTLSQLGTQTGLVYHVARLRALGKAQSIPHCLSVALRPVAVAGGIAGVILAVGGVIWESAQGGSTATSIAHQLWVLAAFLPVASMSDAMLAGTRGFGTMKPTVVIESITRTVVQLGFCAAAGLVTSNLVYIALAWAAPYLGSAAWGASRLRSLTRRALEGDAAAVQPEGFARQFWRFTAPRGIASVAQMLLQRLDIVLVAALRGPVDAAIYTASTRLLVGGQLGGSAISGAVQPRLAEALSSGDVPAARVAYQTATCWLVLLTWPFYLLCIIDAHQFLRVFGHGYATASTVAVILAASMLVGTACGMVDLVLTMGGRTTWNLANTIGALIINVSVDLLLIPRYGVVGAAIGWAAAIVFNNLVPLFQIWHAMKLHPFGSPTLLAFAITTGVFAVIPGAVALSGNRDLVPSLVAIAVSLVVYCGILLLAWRRLRLGELLPTERLRRLIHRPAMRTG